jgi:hypothetical protein
VASRHKTRGSQLSYNKCLVMLQLKTDNAGAPFLEVTGKQPRNLPRRSCCQPPSAQHPAGHTP